MMYIVQHHNEFNSLEDAMYGPFEQLEDAMYGPFEQIDEATSFMQYLVDLQNDELFKIRTDEYKKFDPNEFGYAGYEAEELIDAGRNEDLTSELWVQIHIVFPPNR